MNSYTASHRNRSVTLLIGLWWLLLPCPWLCRVLKRLQLKLLRRVGSIIVVGRRPPLRLLLLLTLLRSLGPILLPEAAQHRGPFFSGVR